MRRKTLYGGDVVIVVVASAVPSASGIVAWDNSAKCAGLARLASFVATWAITFLNIVAG